MNASQDRISQMNRRRFLKTTSTAVAAMATVGAATHAHAAIDSTVRVALVGCGGRGSGAAREALRTEGSVKLVAMADVSRDRLQGSHRSLSEQLGDRVEVPEDSRFVGFDAYKEAVSRADVVILATPPGFRPIHFEEAVRQGKNVFMEKPVAIDAPGVRRVLAAAEEAKQRNLKVGVGFQRRHDPGYIETIRRLQDGQIGNILSMRCYWHQNGPIGPKARRADLERRLGRPPTEMEYQVANWYMFTWLCGDHNVEQHVHNIDVINWVKNAYPVRARGFGGRAWLKGADSGEIFDHHCVEYEYADGSWLASHCSQIPRTISDISEHVAGANGTCEVNRQTIRGAEAWRYQGQRGSSTQQEHHDLFAAIRNNTPYNEVHYGARSTLTAIMGRMATYSGKAVTWEEALNSEVNLMPKEFSWEAMPQVLPDADGNYPYAIPGQTVAV